MRVKDLDQALSLIRQTGYGLTAALESLDDREQAYWCDRVAAGNLYVNRGTTGALVLRQPFGGMGKSAFGPGIKAGGPNYVAQLMDFSDGDPPAGPARIADPDLADLRARLRRRSPPGVSAESGDLPRVVAALQSYCANSQEEFGRTHDHFRLLGQDNLRRYLPVPRLRIRVHPSDSLFEIFARVCAAKAVGCRATVSLPGAWTSPATDWLRELTESWAAAIEFVHENDDELAATIGDGQLDRVRYAAPDRVPEIVLRAATASGVYLARAPGRNPGPGGVALVPQGTEHQPRLPPLRQSRDPGRGEEDGRSLTESGPWSCPTWLVEIHVCFVMNYDIIDVS